MAILNFTGATTESSSSTGYFAKFDILEDYYYSEYGYNFYWGRLYTTSTGRGGSNEFNTFAYSVKTTDDQFSLASYFNTKPKINKKDRWNFSANSDYIALSPFALLSYNSQTSANSFKGVQSYENDIINARAGSDFVDLQLNFYSSEYKSTIYKSLMDQVLDGGYRTTINGGDGNDTISVGYYQGDYAVNKIGTTSTATVIPVAIVNGDSGNDQIGIYGMAGKVNGDTAGVSKGGADIIETVSFSDRIIGGAGADVIDGCSENLFDSRETFRQALVQKDVITGGPGRDTFIISFTNAYGLNGTSDFAVITDFQRIDRIASIYYRGDLLVDGQDRTISLPKTSAYAAIQNLQITASIYLDSDGSGTINPAEDELLMYVAGYQPTADNFIYGL